MTEYKNNKKKINYIYIFLVLGVVIFAILYINDFNINKLFSFNLVGGGNNAVIQQTLDSQSGILSNNIKEFINTTLDKF